MKKTLIAMAVLAASGAAYAQSNVTIYGAVDINYTKVRGESVFMDERYNNRLGFMGSEDLGNGLKATFQLEQRFTLFDGRTNGGVNGDGQDRMFNGAANVGLAGSFGQVRFGRLNEIATETYRQIDPFQQYGVAGMIETIFRGGNWDPIYGGGNGRLSSTARYDSMNMNGFKLMASYTLRNSENGDYAENNGYAVGGTYNNGPLYLVANYNKVANSSSSNNWNVGAAYAFGPAKLSAGYESSKDKVQDETQKNWIVGLSYKIGAGVINASYNQSDWLDGKQKKYALGYTHNLSKRTSVYANYAHTKNTDYPNADLDSAASGSSSAVEVGITHKF